MSKSRGTSLDRGIVKYSGYASGGMVGRRGLRNKRRTFQNKIRESIKRKERNKQKRNQGSEYGKYGTGDKGTDSSRRGFADFDF